MKKIILSALWCALLFLLIPDATGQTFKERIRMGTGRLIVDIDPPQTGPLNFLRFTFNITPPSDDRFQFFGESFYRHARVTDRFKTFHPANGVKEKIESDMVGFGAHLSDASDPHNLKIVTSCEVLYPDIRGFIWHTYVAKVRLHMKATLHDSTLIDRQYETLYVTSGLDTDWTIGLVLSDPYDGANAAMNIALRKTLDNFYLDLNWILNPLHAVVVSGTVTDARTHALLRPNVMFRFDTTRFINRGSGTFDASLPRDRDFEFKVSSPGYISLSKRISARDLRAGCRHLNFELEPLPVGAGVNFSNVIFRTGTAELIGESYSHLLEVVSFLKHNPTAKIELDGHTDLGDPKLNLKLSKARVDKIKSYLVANGISSRRIKSKEYGDTHPLSIADKTIAHEQNRRVEFTIISE